MPDWDLNHHSMMTSSNANILRVTGPLCEDFTGHRWIPLKNRLICPVGFTILAISFYWEERLIAKPSTHIVPVFFQWSIFIITWMAEILFMMIHHHVKNLHGKTCRRDSEKWGNDLRSFLLQKDFMTNGVYVGCFEYVWQPPHHQLCL